MIEILFNQGYSKKRIARELNMSINTVRRYLSVENPSNYKRREVKPMKLDPYRDYIQKRIAQAHPVWLPATVIYAEIKALGYEGKISRLRDYLLQLKPQIKESSVIRFEGNTHELFKKKPPG